MKKTLLNLLISVTLILLSCTNDVPSPIISPIISLQTNSTINEQLSFNKLDKSKIDSLLIKKSKTHTILHSKTAHLAFPDFLKYKDYWYLTFRISDAHVTKKSSNILIYKSRDLENWQMEQVFSQEGYDLRDPKLFIHKDTLFMQFHSTSISPYGHFRNDFTVKYDFEKSNWLVPQVLNKNENSNSWFWRISSINNKLYVGAYLEGNLRIFDSANNIDYHNIYSFDLLDNQLTESTFRERDSKLYALIRVNFKNAILGICALNDLNNWDFKELPWNNIGGPNFLIYQNYLLIGGRKNAKTALYKYNLNNDIFTLVGETQEIRYDSGYPGMYIEDNLLYFIYYTNSPEGEFQINLSVINLDMVL